MPYSHTPILILGPLNTRRPVLSTTSLQPGSSMMADWGHRRYIAAVCTQIQGSNMFSPVSTSFALGKRPCKHHGSSRKQVKVCFV